jgi:hypothetical protein
MKIASAPAIARPPREQAVPEPSSPIPEPISPELVLVDPTLREALLARESAARVPLQVVPDVEPAQAPPESVPEPEPVAVPKIVWFSDRHAPVPAAPPTRAVEVPGGRRRKAVRVILPISLALNAILIALSVSDATVSPQATSPAPAIDATAQGNTTRTPASPPKSGQGSSSGSKAGATSVVTHPRNGALERKLLNLVVQAPAGRLPRALIDSKTGLAKNGLQAVCRREKARSFLCVVQPPRHKLGEGLHVRYRVNRKGNGGTFRWYRYRKG